MSHDPSSARNFRGFAIFISLSFIASLAFPSKIFAQSPKFDGSSVETTAATTAGTKVPIASNSSSINLTLSPISLFLETSPGDPVQATVKIRNNGKERESLKITFGTFTADDTGDHPKLLTPGPEDHFMQWIKAEPSEFVIPPDSWQSVNISFSPPKDAALTYYYTILVDRLASDARPGETVIKGSPAIMSLAYVRSPNAVRELSLSSFESSSPVLEYLPQTFKIKLKNTGNVYSVPAGNIFIDGQGKTDIGVLSINPKSLTVLPDSSRTLEVTWDDGFPLKESESADAKDEKDASKKEGTHFLDAIWDLSKADRFRFGKYTAHLLLVYDNGQRDVPVESFISFWVIPWKILLSGLVAVVLVLLGLRSLLLLIFRAFRQEKSQERSSREPPTSSS